MIEASVVVPTHRRPGSLARVLEGLAAQDVPPGAFEVVVVCDGPGDDALPMLRAGVGGLRLVAAEQPNRGPAAARNHGLRLARGRLAVFLDDDVVPSPGLVRAHLRAHEAAGDLVVIGPLLPPPGWGSPWVRFEGRTLEEQYRQVEAGAWAMGPRQFYTGNASVLRAQLEAAGGFDEGFRRAEDVELAYRLRERGLRFRFERAAAVLHLAERPYGAWLETARRYGEADVRMGRDGGRRDVLESMGREFHWRHPLTRAAVRAGLRLPPLGRAIEAAGRPASLLASALGRERLAQHVLGGAFNVAYWRGAAAALGGSAGALALVAEHRPAARPAEAAR
jgi:GT2 family glycosyltransferase